MREISKELNDLQDNEKIISSNCYCKDFTVEELEKIYISLHVINDDGVLDNGPDLFMAYAFHLNSEGAITFIKKKLPPMLIMKKIIQTCGLPESIKSYAAKDLLKTDLNEDILMNLYLLLAKFDIKKAESVKEMILRLPILNSIYLVESLYQFVQLDYCNELLYMSIPISEHQKKYMYFSSRNYRGADPEYIKQQFLRKIEEYHQNHQEQLKLQLTK